MKSVHILEQDDILLSTDWVRPLVVFHNPELDVNPYSGFPHNHKKWCAANRCIGECWINKPIREFTSAMKHYGTYEFIRGDIPSSHVIF